MRVVGCIGCGNMGGAILGGLIDSLSDKYDFMAHTRTPIRMAPLLKKGVIAMPDALTLAQKADIVILAVKPHQIAAIIDRIVPALDKDKLLVSIAAGISLKRLKELCRGLSPVVRCMPNTPAMVGKGIFALCLEDSSLKQTEKNEIQALFTALGLTLSLGEKQFTAFSALIGAGPAYVFEMMRGLAQAGVTLGFSHQQSRELVTALFAGSAALAKDQEEHFIQLRDAVCSPAGLTIAGVNCLERAGLSGLLVEAVLRANIRGREMEE